MTIDERFAALKAQLADVKNRLDTEKAEREALQRMVVPPLAEVRKDLQLNIDYITQRLGGAEGAPCQRLG
jgi:hypothetical protein